MGKLEKINLKISIPITVLKEGRNFIVYSPTLDLSTSAHSFEKAKVRFDEVVQIFFEELLEKGTLDKTLYELGWQKVQKQWAPPIIISQEAENFKIPLPATKN